MDINQLETLLAVSEEKGFSRAAARLHRTQPAVSQVIRKLEGELGEVLVERGSRDGALTAAGAVLGDYARRLIKLRAEAETALAELKSLERGRLQLAANEYTCLYLLRVLDRFRKVCPQIKVSVRRSFATNIPDEVAERVVELGVLSFTPEGDRFRSIAVYTDDLEFVVGQGHPLAGMKSVSVADLGAENFIAHEVDSPLRRQVIAAFAQHRTPLNMGVELPSLEAVKRFVAMGNGVAFVPGLTVEREVERGELIRIPVEDLRFERRLRLIQRRQAPLSYAAAAFLKVVRALTTDPGAPFEYEVEQPS